MAMKKVKLFQIVVPTLFIATLIWSGQSPMTLEGWLRQAATAMAIRVLLEILSQSMKVTTVWTQFLKARRARRQSGRPSPRHPRR